MNTYSFSNITHEEVRIFFQLKQDFEPTTIFKSWISKANKLVINEKDQELLLKPQTLLKRYVNDWNETELLLYFITPIIYIVDFQLHEFNVVPFAERTLSKKIQNTLFQGRVDWMVATGRQHPRQPFFFIHEYKKGLDSSGDPVGQLLSTMYIAQMINNQPKKPTLFDPTPKDYKDLPIYGCYVIGRYWYFVVLKDKDYYISESYDATKTKDLQEIVKLLKAQKQMIIERVTQNQ